MTRGRNLGNVNNHKKAHQKKLHSNGMGRRVAPADLSLAMKVENLIFFMNAASESPLRLKMVCPIFDMGGMMANIAISGGTALSLLFAYK